ncbi:Acetyltransferase component of pyruvate dehydrogenase complex [Apiospora aurea]|uniref:Dihydrolipoamide acetyltransferase component of pyruvate dehydrogenase complex n=1 Tax=Apiospora aurea TaxID=335848 RepID=A0ABR1QG69_9PEZI
MFSAVLRRQALRSTSSLRVAGLSPQLARWYTSFPPHTVIKMPALSPTMTSGGIGAWQKKAGDTIAPGDVLVEIETDKAQMDFEFQEDGVIAKVLKDAGAKDVAVGSPIAVLVEEGTDVSAFESFGLSDAGGEASAPAPKEEKKSESSSSGSSSAPTPAAPEQYSSEGRLETALQREAKKPKQTAAAAAGGASGAAAPAAASYEDIPLTNMRKTIAKRLQESTQNNPHFFVTSKLSVSKLLKLREALNAGSDGKFKISVNDFLIKAIAVASKKVPAANSSWQGDFIRQFNSVDVSVAVATPNGLITPIVTGADARGLESISNQVKALAKKARDGKLKPEEYQGGSISISNMGMNDAVDNFTASTILAVGTTRKVAIPVETAEGTSIQWDDQITITASFDHKVVDGAVGAEWVKALKQAIENPLELML